LSHHISNARQFKADFSNKVAVVLLQIPLATFTGSASFTDNQNVTYSGKHFYASVSADGAHVDQVYMVTTLSNGAPYRFPVNTPADVASFNSFVAGGGNPSIAALYAPADQYILVSAADLPTLQAAVNLKLQAGYVLAGNAFTTSTSGTTTLICQPMLMPP
jgi:hypothetical protein